MSLALSLGHLPPFNTEVEMTKVQKAAQRVLDSRSVRPGLCVSSDPAVRVLVQAFSNLSYRVLVTLMG